MNSDNPKHLARALLANEVQFPGVNPSDPHGPPVELPRRLGDVLTSDVLDLIGRDPETLAESFGPDWGGMIRDYDSLCSELKTLSVTGRVDRHLLHRGGAALGLLIGGVRRDEEGARAMLDPDSPDVTAHHERLGLTAAQASKDMRDSYFSYICFRCARDALETLRDGLEEINRALDRRPSGPRKA